MKIQIEFDNQEDALHALNALKYISALKDFDNALRNKVKYAPDNTPPDRLDAYIEIRDLLHEHCEGFSIWD